MKKLKMTEELKIEEKMKNEETTSRLDDILEDVQTEKEADDYISNQGMFIDIFPLDDVPDESGQCNNASGFIVFINLYEAAIIFPTVSPKSSPTASIYTSGLSNFKSLKNTPFKL